MTGDIDDGQLLPAVFDGVYVGLLGVQTVGAERQAAFVGTLKREAAMAAVGKVGVIGDQPHRIVSIAPSPISRAMTRMVVEAVEV